VVDPRALYVNVVTTNPVILASMILDIRNAEFVRPFHDSICIRIRHGLVPAVRCFVDQVIQGTPIIAMGTWRRWWRVVVAFLAFRSHTHRADSIRRRVERVGHSAAAIRDPAPCRRENRTSGNNGGFAQRKTEDEWADKATRIRECHRLVPDI
jgi:hypothetical protein